MRKNLKTITEIIEKMKTLVENDLMLDNINENQAVFLRMQIEVLENLAIEVKNIKSVMENVTLNAEEIDTRLNIAEDVLCDILDCIVPNDEDDEDE